MIRHRQPWVSDTAADKGSVEDQRFDKSVTCPSHDTVIFGFLRVARRIGAHIQNDGLATERRAKRYCRATEHHHQDGIKRIGNISLNIRDIGINKILRRAACFGQPLEPDERQQQFLHGAVLNKAVDIVEGQLVWADTQYLFN